MGKVLNIAHRGASAYEPENTLRSIKRGTEFGADFIEVDVRLCKDGYVAVIHDETVDRTTDGKGYVRNLTLQQLKKLNAGRGEKIPTLQEVVDLVKGRVKLIIEVKERGMEGKALKIVKDRNVEGEVLITSFFHKTIKAVKEADPQIKTGVIFRCEPINPSELALKADADALFPFKDYVSLEMVEEAHRHGLFINVWTVDEPREMAHFINMGVDGIVTNKPDILKTLLTSIEKGADEANLKAASNIEKAFT